MSPRNFSIFYNGNEFPQTFDKNDLMTDILNNFIKNNNTKDISKFLFIINGKEISFNFLKKGRIKAEMYERKKIFAFKLNINIRNWKLENILCPECKNLAFITYNDEIISLECKICNKKTNYSISEFMDIQLESSNLRRERIRTKIKIKIMFCLQSSASKK